MKKEKNKDNILNSSLAYISKNGLENFSMRKLANSLQCQPASIYYYYESKEEILNDLYLKIRNDFINSFEIIMEPQLSKHDFIRFIIENALEHREEYIFLNNYVKSSFMNRENIRLAKSMNDDISHKMRVKLGPNPSKEDFIILTGTIYQLVKLEKKDYQRININLIIDKLIMMMEVN